MEKQIFDQFALLKKLWYHVGTVQSYSINKKCAGSLEKYIYTLTSQLTCTILLWHYPWGGGVEMFESIFNLYHH